MPSHAYTHHIRTSSKQETLFGIFSPSHHTVLVFTQKYEAHSALALSSIINRQPGGTVRTVLILPSEADLNEDGTVYDEVFIDYAGHSHAYHLRGDQPHFVVVRPDGVIGTRVHDVAGVERYFQNIFS